MLAVWSEQVLPCQYCFERSCWPIYKYRWVELLLLFARSKMNQFVSGLICLGLICLMQYWPRQLINLVWLCLILSFFLLDGWLLSIPSDLHITTATAWVNLWAWFVVNMRYHSSNIYFRAVNFASNKQEASRLIVLEWRILGT